jgi:hypothetical protein
MIANNAFATLFLMAALGACQSAEPRTFAVLETSDAETLAKLKSILAGAMNSASVEIGPGDLTTTSSIAVLPPRPGPYEGRSLATPTQFDLMMRESRCVVVRRDTGEEFALPGVPCRPRGG